MMVRFAARVAGGRVGVRVACGVQLGVGEGVMVLVRVTEGVEVDVIVTVGVGVAESAISVILAASVCCAAMAVRAKTSVGLGSLTSANSLASKRCVRSMTHEPSAAAPTNSANP